MPDSHEIASEIEMFLDSPHSQRHQGLDDLAASYSSLCEATNVRLRRCADYLRRGLYSEVIYHAEIEPDLLDSVGALDLRRIDEWDAICQGHGLEHAPRLLLDVAREINEVYSAEQPLHELLIQFRKLSLAKAPLRTRLDKLRSIAAIDDNPPHWDEDVRAFETERLNEIAKEAKQAAKREDLERLQGLVHETTHIRWRVPIPTDLHKDLRQAVRRIQTDRALRDLRALLPELSDAYSGELYPDCSMLLRQWDQIVSDDRVPVPADMLAQIQPIRAWVKKQEDLFAAERNFANACDELRNGLDDKVTDAVLLKQYRQASSFDRPIPEDLQLRYRQEMNVRKIEKGRRARVRLAIGIPVVLMIAMAVAFFVYQNFENRKADQWHAEISGLITTGKLTKAVKRFEALAQEEPGFASRANFSDLKGQLDQLVGAEGDRKKQFRAAMDQAIQAGVEEPDTVSLSEAKQLAMLPKEELKVGEFEGRVEEEARKQQRARDEAFREEADPVIGQIAALKQEEFEKSPDTFKKKLLDLNDELRRLQNTPRISGEVMAELTPSKTRLRTRGDDIEKMRMKQSEHRQQEQEIASLARDAGVAADLGKALEAFAAKHLSSEKSPAFKKAARQVADWTAAQEWLQLTGSWKRVPVPKEGSDITKRVKEIEAFIINNPSSSFSIESLEAYAEYLKRAELVLANDGPWKQDLAFLQKGSSIRDFAKFVETKEGNVYYLPEDDTCGKDSVGPYCRVILTDDTANYERQTFEKGFSPKPQPSPHIALADNILKKQADLDSSNWDTFEIDVTEMIRSRAGVNSVLKALLLDSLGKAGWGMEEQVKTMFDTMSSLIKEEEKKQGDDNDDKGSVGHHIRWMNPDDKDASRSRVEIEKVLGELESFADLRETVRKNRDEITKAVFPNPVGYGVVIHEENQWQVKTTITKLRKDMEAMVIVNEPADQAKVFRRIGAVEKGEFVVDEGAMADVPEGSMVFLFEGNSG